LATTFGIFIILKLLTFLIPGETSGNIKELNALIFIVSFLIAIPFTCWISDIRRALKIADEKKITLEKAWQAVKIENMSNDLY
jgi:hypothetical protein